MDIWLFLHILSAIVAFGALFGQPIVARSVPGTGDAFAKVGLYIQAPALVLLIATGIGRMYSTNRDFAETWVSIAFSVWIAVAVLLGLLIRAHRKESPAVSPLTGGMHLLLAVALWAMIWQPGAGG